MIVDTSFLLALFNAGEPRHDEAQDALSFAADDQLVVSPYVIAELDHLVATRGGLEAEVAVLAELYQAIGLADASQVVLADRYGTSTVATLDRRHFSVLRPIGGRGRFTLLP